MIALNEAAEARARTAVLRVYPAGGVPAGADREYPYATVSVTSERSAVNLKSGRVLQVMRLTTMVFGQARDSVIEVAQLLDRVFVDQRLTATGWACDPIQLQVSGPVVVNPSAGQVLSVTATYLFTAKEAKA